MPTLEEKLAEVQGRLEVNLEKVQQLQEEIKTKQNEAAALTRPILEDQGSFRTLQELIENNE